MTLAGQTRATNQVLLSVWYGLQESSGQSSITILTSAAAVNYGIKTVTFANVDTTTPVSSAHATAGGETTVSTIYVTAPSSGYGLSFHAKRDDNNQAFTTATAGLEKLLDDLRVSSQGRSVGVISSITSTHAMQFSVAKWWGAVGMAIEGTDASTEPPSTGQILFLVSLMG